MTEELSQYNVFIFNYIKNNQRDLELLRTTFKNLDCRVKLHNDLSYKEFHEAVHYITHYDFAIYEYAVIVLLSNTNPARCVLRTSDNRLVFITRDLLNPVERNHTLRRYQKKLLVISQINLNSMCGEEYKRTRKANPPPKEQSPPGGFQTPATCKLFHFKVPGNTIKLNATYGLLLNNYWSEPNAPESPFIRAFCTHFGQHSVTRTIDYIYSRMLEELPSSQSPVIEKQSGQGECVFGRPFRKKKFVKHYLKDIEQ